MEETFRTILGFEDYQVSNLGRVISNKAGKNVFLKPQNDRLGYVHVRLFPTEPIFGKYPGNRGKKPKLYKVHRLVLETFFPEGETEERNEVNHLNGNKRDNRLENLQWVSRSENLQHAVDIGLKTEGSLATGRTKWKPVKAIYSDGTVEYFESRMHASLAFGTSALVIGTSIRKQKKVVKGKCKNVIFYDCTELPKGETFKKILNIESKLMQYRENYWGSKNKEKRRQWYKNYKTKKNQI